MTTPTPPVPSTPSQAVCCNCGQLAAVCCDAGYVDNPDGTTTHDDPFCPACCPCEPAQYRRHQAAAVADPLLACSCPPDCQRWLPCPCFCHEEPF